MIENKLKMINWGDLRRRAEEWLGNNSQKVQSPGKDMGLLKLQHELQVYQIELELQNAELRQTRDELETALEMYTDLYDFAPVGYFTLDRKGTIRSVNLTGAGLLGIERSLLIGRLFESFVVAETRSVFSAFFEKVFTSLVKEACEVMLLNKEKVPNVVQVEGLAETSGQECRIILIDITDRKLAEEALHISRDAAEMIKRAKAATEKLHVVKRRS